MNFDTLKLETKDKVANVILNRPEKLNAISPRLIQELETAIDELACDEKVRVVVIQGAGRAFSSGTDLQSLASRDMISSSSAFRWHLFRMQETFYKLDALEKPTLAKVHGYALGAAMELALACDFRISAKDAQWGLPEVMYSLVPDLGGCQRLVKMIGLSKAKEFVMMGRAVTGEMAETLGIVNKAVDPEKLDEEVQEWIDQILKLPPLAVAMGKKIITLCGEATTHVSSEYISQVQSALIGTQDFCEALKARLEKREPVFKGR